MAVTQGFQVIDADTHVVESDRTWEYLDPADRKYRPTLVSAGGDKPTLHWLIDGKVSGHRAAAPDQRLLAEISERSGRDVDTPAGAREMEDVSARLEHMDKLGVDIQVLYNTLWIEEVTTRPEIDVALCRSWNRWLADIWKDGKGRLRWSCVPPFTDLENSIKEIKSARNNGAVAISMRPMEGNRLLLDPYFYPIYELASDLDMAIAIHIANGNAAVCDALGSSYDPGAQFGRFRVPTVASCHALIMSEIPQRFPKLRWAFVESSSQWIPWVINEAKRRYSGAGKPFPKNVLNEYQMYVACQSDDDLPYILQYSGDDNIITGSDYGHADPSSQLDTLKIVSQLKGVSQKQKDNILYYNPKALYGL